CRNMCANRSYGINRAGGTGWRYSMPTIKRMQGAIVACLLVAAGSAYADQPTLTDAPNQGQSCENEMANCPQNQPPPHAAPAPAPMPPPPAESRPWYETIGYGLSAGGGVSDFASGAANDATGTAGDWNVRFTMGTHSYIAGEALYFGSAQSINAIGLSNG